MTKSKARSLGAGNRKGKEMKSTGIFVTPEELETVKVAYKCSGMFLTGGKPMGDPEWEVGLLTKKYNPPKEAGLNIKTGEFVLP